MVNKTSDEFWRVYRREAVIVHTAAVKGLDGRDCLEHAKAWARQNLEGRVRRDDIQYELHTDGGVRFWCYVKVVKDNLKGEFKNPHDAELFAVAQKYDEYTIVPRNSAADQEIRNYGITKL